MSAAPLAVATAMQTCCILVGVARDITAYATVCDAADAELKRGRLERDVIITATYPSPAGAPGGDGPEQLLELSLPLHLPWRSPEKMKRMPMQPRSGQSAGDVAAMPELQTEVPSRARGRGSSSRMRNTPYSSDGMAASNIRSFVLGLLRGRVMKHPRVDRMQIVHRSAFNSTAKKDLESGRGPTSVLEHMELDEQDLGDSRVPKFLKETGSRLPMVALTPFTKACTCLANATIGGGHGVVRKSATREGRFKATVQVGQGCYEQVQAGGQGRATLDVCVAIQLFPELSFFCLVATDKVLKEWEYTLPIDVNRRLPESITNTFTPDMKPGASRWINMEPSAALLYKHALGTGALTAGVAWSLMKFCGLWNPAIGAASYGTREFGQYYSQLCDKDYHRELFSGPATFRDATPGKRSKAGAVSQLPLSVLSEEQYRDFLLSLQCKDKKDTGGSMLVPTVAIAVGRCLLQIRRICQNLLDGRYRAELQRVVSSQSALNAFRTYDEDGGATPASRDAAQLNKTRHIIRTAFGAAPLAEMLVDPGQVDEATWNMDGVPEYVSDLVWLLTRGLHLLMYPWDEKDKTMLPDVMPKVLLPLATFCLKWGEVKATTRAGIPRYSDLPHGYSLGNEYDCEPEAIRGGKELSKASTRRWLQFVQRPIQRLISLQGECALEKAQHHAERCASSSDTEESGDSEKAGPVAVRTTSSPSENERAVGAEEDCILAFPNVATADAAPVVEQEEVDAAASVAGPADSGRVYRRRTPNVLVPKKHMRCLLGGLECENTPYTSRRCFLSCVLCLRWNAYAESVRESARAPSLPASEVGNCYDNPSDAVEHLASLAWAESSADIWECLKKCDERGGETGMYRSAKNALFERRTVGSVERKDTDICDHCMDTGNQFVQIRLCVGDDVTETPGWDAAQQREQQSNQRRRSRRRRGEDADVKQLPLRRGMIAAFYTAKAGSALELAYVRDVSGPASNRVLTFIFVRDAYERLDRDRLEEIVKVTALYDTTATARLLRTFEALQTDAAKVSRVRGAGGLPAVEDRSVMVSGFDPILECFAHPSVFFRLREQCKTAQARGPGPSDKWMRAFTQPFVPLRVNLPPAIFDEDDRRRRAQGRKDRVSTIDTVFALMKDQTNPNPAQLSVLKDQQYMHLNVIKGVTTVPRRIVFVLGGGGVGKSSLLGPLISVNLATNWKTEGHPLSGEAHKTREGGNAIVGIFAEMNRAIDSCVRTIMRPGALRTAKNTHSRAKIFRVGGRCDDHLVRTLTLDFMAKQPIHELHPAWQRPPEDAPAHLKTSFDEFEVLRAEFQRCLLLANTESVGGAAGRLHAARRKLLRHLFVNADIIASTISAAASWEFEEFEGTFSTVYVDEGSRARADQMLHLLTGRVGKEKVRNAVVIGDPNQNPPHSSTMETLADAYIRRSLFAVVASAPEAQIFFLDTQYRMHPAICEYASNEFYDGKLKNGRPLEAFSRKYHDDPRSRFDPVLFWDTAGDARFVEHRGDQEVVAVPDESEESFSSASGLDTVLNGDDGEKAAKRKQKETEMSSCANKGEAKLCVAIAVRLVTSYPCGGSTDSSHAAREKPGILIIAPYVSQRNRIHKLVCEEPLLAKGRWDISVLTVEKSQGEQADVVIVSTVRSQYVTKLGHFGFYPHRVEPTPARARSRFVSQRSRLAVMCTRARFSMIIIGDSDLLASVEGLEEDEREEGLAPQWRSLVEHYKRKGYLRPVLDAQASYEDAETRRESSRAVENPAPKRRKT